MPRYRRIEVKAFNRRVTIVSGEWPSDFSNAKPSHPADEVSFADTNLGEPVEPDSPEGQLILVEAVRSLERRLSPEARATIRADQDTLASSHSNRNGFYRKLETFFQLTCATALRFARKEK